LETPMNTARTQWTQELLCRITHQPFLNSISIYGKRITKKLAAYTPRRSDLHASERIAPSHDSKTWPSPPPSLRLCWKKGGPVHEAMQQRPVQTRSTWQGMSSFILAMPCNEPSLDYLTISP
jgi:hypothetical protein